MNQVNIRKYVQNITHTHHFCLNVILAEYKETILMNAGNQAVLVTNDFHSYEQNISRYIFYGPQKKSDFHY